MNVQPRKTAVRSRHIHSLSAAVISDSGVQPVVEAIAIGVISDAASVQRALSAVINAVAAGTLDPARARVLLYGLQIAATNAHRLAASAKNNGVAPVIEQTATGVEPAAIETTIAPVQETGRHSPSKPCDPEWSVPHSSICHPERSAAAQSKDLHSCTHTIVCNEEFDSAERATADGSLQTAPETPVQTDACAEQRCPPAYLNTVPGYSSGIRERLLALRARSQGSLV